MISLASKGDIALHALSLSETKDGSKRIKWSTKRHTSNENEVDTALRSLQELDEERDLSNDEIGRIILRRANPDDANNIAGLLNKNEMTSTLLAKKKRSSIDEPTDVEGENIPCSESDNVEENAIEGKANRTEDELKLGEDSILLVLSRAVALHDPPLGCAILTLESSSDEERNLTLCKLSHEEHLPRERFVECLEAFAKALHCNLNTLGTFRSPSVTSDEIKSFLSRSLPYHAEDEVINRIKGNSIHLQSVKEEDSEEVDDGSESTIVDDNKGSGLVKGRPSKPSKRSRVA